MRTNSIVRTFKKEHSVFKDWKEDTPEQIADCIEHDIKMWHVSRFIKDDEERLAVENVIRRFAEMLKNAFIQGASRGTFPYLGWNDFSGFC